MADVIFQNWLGFEGCSKRGVRYRQLAPSESDQVWVDVATDGGPGMTAIGYDLAVNSLGARRMLTHYTEPLSAATVTEKGPDGKEREVLKEPDLDDPKLVWKQVDATTIELGYAPIFNTKDADFLESEFKSLHKANPREIAAFLGKRKTVRST